MALFANHTDHFIHILLAGIVVRCFHHDTDHRLGTGFTHQNATSIAQCFSNFTYRFLHSRVCSVLPSYP